MTAPRMTPTNDAPVTVEEALRWYAENTAGCRKIGRDGDVFRQALDADGGKRALAALPSAPAGDGDTSVEDAIMAGRAVMSGEGDGTYDEAVAAIEGLVKALARPRAAVGEQSREAIAADIARVVGCQINSDRTRRIVDYILALQSPPAKVEG